MDKEKETFNYTYSAKDQEEIKKIRNKYTQQNVEEDKMSRLRRLDASVYSKATVVSLVFGIIGTLLMGTGMSLIMTDISEILGMFFSMIVGIGVGITGIILVCLAYPIYNRTIKKERKKIAPEILALTDELMK